MSDWFIDNLGWFIAAVIGAMLVATFMLIKIDAANRQEFMRQCLQDHKEYECVAMWRAGESHVIPIVTPVIIPSR